MNQLHLTMLERVCDTATIKDTMIVCSFPQQAMSVSPRLAWKPSLSECCNIFNAVQVDTACIHQWRQLITVHTPCSDFSQMVRLLLGPEALYSILLLHRGHVAALITPESITDKPCYN